MALNYLAPAPYASFVTRNGAFEADGNGLICNVGAGAQALDLPTHTPNAISINGAAVGTAGQAALLLGGGGSGWIIASADF